ncbi:MAG: transposase [Pseudonocardiaceae bacterium]
MHCVRAGRGLQTSSVIAEICRRVGVDLTRGPGSAWLLDIVAGRSTSTLVHWINERDSVWRAGIVTAALDPYRGYASALRTALPDSVRVLDAGIKGIMTRS